MTIKIVVDMTADLFHRGHVMLLKNARDYFKDRKVHLTVALHTDEQVFGYKNRYPAINYHGRKEVLEACRYVDRLVKAPEKFDREFIDQYDFMVHGDDMLAWPDELINFFYEEAIAQGKLVTVPYTKGVSSSQIRSTLQLEDVNTIQ